MTLWNEAVETAPRTADKDVPFICQRLLQRVGYRIPPEVWMPHLLNLWENRQLGRDDMLILMKEYHDQRALVASLEELTMEEDDIEMSFTV